MKAIRNRLRQGLAALLAFHTSPDLELAREYLTQRELVSFKSMSRADQVHSLRVLRLVLRAAPKAPSPLTRAALLHDIGKSRYHLAVWQKSLSVVLLRIAPSLCRKLSDERSFGKWRAPFVVSQHHPKWSGELLRDCGADAAVIWLAEHHHDDSARLRNHEWISLLTALQAADNA